MRGAVGVGVLVAAMLLGLFVAPVTVKGAMPQCAGSTASKFLGNGTSPSGLIGVYTEIEREGKQLCTQGSGTPVGSWSLSWISLDGSDTKSIPGINIFQGGYAQCPPPTVGSCPYNGGVLYFWDYYAHEYGVCGAAFNTGFIDYGNPSSGYHFFQISRVGTQYNFYIDEVLRDHWSRAAIETCWSSGIVGGEWQNEMLNDSDQGGGHVGNPQGFHKNQYQTSTGWHNANRTLGYKCDANSNTAHWHCNTSSTAANYFDAYDDRVP